MTLLAAATAALIAGQAQAEWKSTTMADPDNGRPSVVLRGSIGTSGDVAFICDGDGVGAAIVTDEDWSSQLIPGGTAPIIAIATRRFGLLTWLAAREEFGGRRVGVVTTGDIPAREVVSAIAAGGAMALLLTGGSDSGVWVTLDLDGIAPEAAKFLEVCRK